MLVTACLLALPRAHAAVLSPAPVIPSVAKDNTFCLGCHHAGSYARHAPTADASALENSVHKRLACVECHQGIDSIPHKPGAGAVDCARCHGEESAESLEPPTPGKPARHFHATVKPKPGRHLPACVTCHGTHDIGAPSSLHADVGRERISATCGGCHPREAASYRDSVHGRAALSGNKDVPTCDTCHPEHPQLAKRAVTARGVVATCVSCHDDPGLQQRYSLPGNRLAAYMGSYHGAAAALGDRHAANCASCHGTHDILPSKDPRSAVNPKNLPHTCGRCHPGATANFAAGKVHLEPSPTQDRLPFYVKTGYFLFVTGMISSFVGYIGLDLLARARKRFSRPNRGGRRNGEEGGAEEEAEEGEDEEEKEFVRLSLNQRVQHWVLITSFTTLLITGLPLASPHSAVAHDVVSFLGGMGARAILHRAAAVTLILLCVYHGFYVLHSRRGYSEFRSLMPSFQDAKDLLQMLRFYFGLTRVPAAFGRFNYIEKFEYLAMGWGSTVMIVTGLLLWSPQISMLIVPKWMMDIAFIVHSWEAILAFLAIIIWHMYNVHFNPSVFPMSRIWLTGKISRHELQENHPLEYARLMEARKAPAREEERDLV